MAGRELGEDRAAHTRLLTTVPWLITAFGIFVLATAVALLRVMGRSGAPGTTSASQAA